MDHSKAGRANDINSVNLEPKKNNLIDTHSSQII